LDEPLEDWVEPLVFGGVDGEEGIVAEPAAAPAAAPAPM